MFDVRPEPIALGPRPDWLKTLGTAFLATTGAEITNDRPNFGPSKSVNVPKSWRPSFGAAKSDPPSSSHPGSILEATSPDA